MDFADGHSTQVCKGKGRLLTSCLVDEQQPFGNSKIFFFNRMWHARTRVRVHIQERERKRETDRDSDGKRQRESI